MPITNVALIIIEDDTLLISVRSIHRNDHDNTTIQKFDNAKNNVTCIFLKTMNSEHIHAPQYFFFDCLIIGCNKITMNSASISHHN
jgi:hypothetical protein